MPDVTPKTESGRALLDALYGLGVDNDKGEALHDILAIEQEAASKAVAEVLDRLDRKVMQLATIDRPAIKRGSDWTWVSRASVRTLIVSERPKESNAKRTET